MYKRILLVLLLFLFATSTAFAYEPDSNIWRWYNSDNTYSIYVYKSPPKLNSFNRTASTLSATAVILMTSNNSNYAYVIEKDQIYYDFNYKFMKGRYLYRIYYDENGNPIYRNDNVSEWVNYPPGTVSEQIGFAILNSITEYKYFYEQQGLIKQPQK